MAVSLRTTVDANTDIQALLLTPREIRRVNRLVTNKLVRAIAKETGGTIPRAARTGVLGFRKKRLFASYARVKQTTVRGSVWLGGNRIAAKYAGKVRNVRGGAKAGKHFFLGSFAATMPNGYRSVFHRKADGSLEQDTIPVTNIEKHALASLLNVRGDAESLARVEVNKILERKVR